MLEPNIIPAIIPQSPLHLREMIAKLGGVVREIQIDIVDGVFVRDISWPYREGNRDENISSLTEMIPKGMSFELDLMIKNPLETLPVWLRQCPKQVVLHIESFTGDAAINSAIELVRGSGSKVLLASLNNTVIERLCAFVPHIDGVQCMGIAEIGRQGNHFDPRALARVRAIHTIYPELSISVDGSVNTDTILLLKAAGANRFVVGSAIFNAADPARAHAELQYLLQRNG